MDRTMKDTLKSISTAEAENTRLPERIRLFSLAGRLDSWRYIAYSLGSLVGVMVALFIISFGLIHLGSLGRTLYIFSSVMLCYGFLPIFFTILTIKRSHDFNTGGWLAILLFVPIVNLLFWFFPGTRGDNRYGRALPIPPLFIKALAVALPILLVAGFLATGSNQSSAQSGVRPAIMPEITLQPYRP